MFMMSFSFTLLACFLSTVTWMVGDAETNDGAEIRKHGF